MPQRSPQPDSSSSAPSAAETAAWPVVTHDGRPFYRIGLPAEGGGPAVTLLVPRQIIQRYEIRSIFARGGGGIIFAGFDLLTLNRVLIKALTGYHLERYGDQLDPAKLADVLRRTRHRLQTERRILVQLRNAGCNGVPNPNDYAFDPNPTLRGPHSGPGGTSWEYEDAELIGSEPFLIMEFIPGRTLEDWLAENDDQGMEPRRAVRIMRQVVQILQVLHQPLETQGMVWQRIYQDLKPSNVLLGSYDRATLLDLGGCQLVINGIGVLEGACTSGFCPPECANYDSLLDPRADVYCVGSTLFALVTGEDPCDERRSKSSSGSRVHAVRLVDQLDGTVAAGPLRDFLRRCLAWDPADRFPDMAAVDAELLRIEQG